MISQKLGLFASGATVVFDDHGHPLFRGGITGSRTCDVANPGAIACGLALHSGVTASIETPVFGCELTQPSQMDREMQQ